LEEIARYLILAAMVSNNLSTPISKCREVAIPRGNASWIDGIGKLDILQTKVIKRMRRIVIYRKLEPIL
jgi:hypothetical protein